MGVTERSNLIKIQKAFGIAELVRWLNLESQNLTDGWAIERSKAILLLSKLTT